MDKKYVLALFLALLYLNPLLSKSDERIRDDGLLQAIASSALEDIQSLLTELPDVDAIYDDHTSFGTTLLGHAACSGRNDVIDLLINQGAKLRLKDEYIYDALQKAVECNQDDVLQHLLEQSFYNDLEEDELVNLLHIAIPNDHMPTFDILLNQIPNYQNPSAYTDLLIVAARHNQPTLFIHLHNLGANIYAKDQSGKKVIHWASNCPEILQYLQENGEDLDALSNDKKNVLHFCVNTNALIFLANAGVTINLQDDKGWTALHYAVADADVELVEMLLKSGADSALKTLESETLIDFELEIVKGSKAIDIANEALALQTNKKVDYQKIVDLLQ
ncbi:MAG: ankyrin repeat domain-containing protein [Chitinophagales bacterium]